MSWIGITGSWRYSDARVETAVRQAVNHIISVGNGIVTGGALGVDWWAVDEARKLCPAASLIKVILPTSLVRYSAHYQQRAKEGVITSAQAEQLIGQLTWLQQTRPGAVIELPGDRPVDQVSYYDRNSAVVAASDQLLAFQVNHSAGTQDTIDKARAKGIPVTVKSYSICPTNISS